MRALRVLFFRFWRSAMDGWGGCWRRWQVQSSRGVSVGAGVHVGASARIVACDGGQIVMGRDVYIGRGVTLLAADGGVISIGDRVHIGEGSIIVALSRCEIGADTLVAEYVVIRDQDHRIAAHPIAAGGFETSPIVIGSNVWLGAKSTVLRGVTLGDGCVVGAHALVRRDAPAGSLMVGVPARLRSVRGDL